MDIDDSPTLIYLEAVVFNVTGLKIRTKTRRRQFVFARTMYYGLCRKYTSYSFDCIGESLKKDHSTVLFHCKNLERDIINNEDGAWDKKWAYACQLVEGYDGITPDTTNGLITRRRIEILTSQNDHLLSLVEKLSGKHDLEDETKLIKLYRRLTELDKQLLIMKAEVTLKMKNYENRLDNSVVNQQVY